MPQGYQLMMTRMCISDLEPSPQSVHWTSITTSGWERIITHG